LAFLIDDTILARVGELDIPFNRFGVDPYGIAKPFVARMLTFFTYMYRHYFTVEVRGIEHVPSRGRAMLVGNHSGGIAIDGAMVIASLFLEKQPPRLVQTMADKFINRVPFMSMWSNRTGNFTGLPENAQHLLEDDRLVMVFPEGARGTAKLYHERYSLVNFGTGFVRLALKSKAPIVPFAFLGGGDAVPTVANSYGLGRLFGAPYMPITPYLLPLPLPVRLSIEYGEPIVLEGTGNEDDHVMMEHVERVKGTIARLIDEGRARRERGLELLPPKERA
jgi:1-acyl-sn-glycerol-3-phosphate acyltransferase